LLPSKKVISSSNLRNAGDY
jgi:hypothetical protein